jgi:hypothetical protein
VFSTATSAGIAGKVQVPPAKEAVMAAITKRLEIILFFINNSFH